MDTVAARWLVELLGFPATSPASFTAGGSTANLAGIGAARQHAGERLGLRPSLDGIGGIPEPRVYASSATHHVVHRALGVLGLGRRNLRSDRPRRIRPHRRGGAGGRHGPGHRGGLHARRGRGLCGRRQHRAGRSAGRAGPDRPRARHLVPCRRRVRWLRAPGRSRPRPRTAMSPRTTRSRSISTSGWRHRSAPAPSSCATPGC